MPAPEDTPTSEHETREEAPARRVFQVLLELAKGYRKHVILITLFSLLSTGADLLQPIIYRNAINDVAGLFVQQGAPATPAPAAPQPHGSGTISPRTPEQTLRSLMMYAALLYLTSIAGYFFYQRSDYLGSMVASRIESNLIVSTFGHVLRLPLGFFSHRASAALAKRVNQSDEVAPVIHAFSQQIAPEIVRLIGICGIMLHQNWELTLIAMPLIPPYLWIARRSARRMKSSLGPYYDMWESISARISDALSAIKTVKLSGAESREADRLDRESTAAYGVYLDRIRRYQRYGFSQSLFSQLNRSLVLAYGGWLVLRHEITPGDVVMFAAYLDRLYAPVDSLNTIAVSLQQNVASLQRAVALREAGPAEPDGTDLPAGPGKVEFRNIRFSYVPGREVLHGLSFTLEPGRITGIVGPSGAGKTTAADLLLKLWQPDSGEIYVDGQAISKLSPATIRRAVGVVSADGAVFRGTLAENIRYKRPTATDAEVLEAALAAGLGRALERLPDGLATEIGEDGIGLSVGERQRLQIARTLVDRPRLLVLDEATANLDYATESELKVALRRLSPRPTMLIIAHRYTMVKEADHVVVLSAGQIAEEGTPEELVAAGGWFAELARQSGQGDESGGD
ncbi:MAG: ABC transporter ATP-binding protein [Bryobacteraceae bacterium]